MEDASPPFTLEQLCRALAAHVLITHYPEAMRSVMAPETAETVAEWIYGFAKGERVGRPNPPEVELDPRS